MPLDEVGQAGVDGGEFRAQRRARADGGEHLGQRILGRNAEIFVGEGQGLAQALGRSGRGEGLAQAVHRKDEGIQPINEGADLLLEDPGPGLVLPGLVGDAGELVDEEARLISQRHAHDAGQELDFLVGGLDRRGIGGSGEYALEHPFEARQG